MGYRNDEEYLHEAVMLAHNNVLNGGGPFGAIIVKDNIIFSGVNRVTANNDPTAHAEVTVIRNACNQLGTHILEGATLFTSCEPCPMCLGAALWSRVDRIVYAADRYDAAAAGFDDATFYQKLEEGNVAEEIVLKNKLQPFQTWKNFAKKTIY